MEIIFAIIVLVIRLISEKCQSHRANRYADMVVRRYEDKK